MSIIKARNNLIMKFKILFKSIKIMNKLNHKILFLMNLKRKLINKIKFLNSKINLKVIIHYRTKNLLMKVIHVVKATTSLITGKIKGKRGLIQIKKRLLCLTFLKNSYLISKKDAIVILKT